MNIGSVGKCSEPGIKNSRLISAAIFVVETDDGLLVRLADRGFQEVRYYSQNIDTS